MNIPLPPSTKLGRKSIGNPIWPASSYASSGFVAVAFIGLSNVGVAIIGVILAMFAFFANDGSTNGGSADDNEI